MSDSVYQLVNQHLSAGKELVLARIIRRSGSTPRDVGSMCIITHDNQILGTVGGGLLEYKVHQKASTMFEDRRSYIYKFTLSNDDLAKNGMICGGDADVFLEVLSPKNPRTVSIFKTIDTRLARHEPLTLVTRIENDLDPMANDLRMLVMADGTGLGDLPGVSAKDVDLTSNLTCQLLESDQADTRFFTEKLTAHPRVYLFGAGHVSTCVSPLAKSVGFDITVVDDRPVFASKERFPDADDVLVADFKQAFDRLEISDNAYILIITRGHLHDKSVLEMSLNTQARYIGMIGSIKKRNIIYADLLKQGYSKEQLEAVHSPVGLEINAQTPEEIAVSIVAQLIKIRAPEKEKKNLIL